MSDSSRVLVVRDLLLPLDVRAAIAGRAQWLRRELPAIDAELGLTYPPIEILPVCLAQQMADGSIGAVSGRVNVGPRDGRHVFVVQLAAAMAMNCEDDLMYGVLAREFLHVVFETLEIADAQAQETTTLEQGDDRELQDRKTSLLLDAARQVRQDEWLSERLSRCAARVENPEDAGLRRALAAVHREWVRRQLPVDFNAVVDYDVQVPFEIDDAILHRAEQLKRHTNP